MRLLFHRAAYVLSLDNIRYLLIYIIKSKFASNELCGGHAGGGKKKPNTIAYYWMKPWYSDWIWERLSSNWRQREGTAKTAKKCYCCSGNIIVPLIPSPIAFSRGSTCVKLSGITATVTVPYQSNRHLYPSQRHTVTTPQQSFVQYTNNNRMNFNQYGYGDFIGDMSRSRSRFLFFLS